MLNCNPYLYSYNTDLNAVINHNWRQTNYSQKIERLIMDCLASSQILYCVCCYGQMARNLQPVSNICFLCYLVQASLTKLVSTLTIVRVFISHMYFLCVVSDVHIHSCIKAECSPSQFSCAVMVHSVCLLSVISILDTNTLVETTC